MIYNIRHQYNSPYIPIITNPLFYTFQLLLIHFPTFPHISIKTNTISQTFQLLLTHIFIHFHINNKLLKTVNFSSMPYISDRREYLIYLLPPLIWFSRHWVKIKCIGFCVIFFFLISYWLCTKFENTLVEKVIFFNVSLICVQTCKRTYIN